MIYVKELERLEREAQPAPWQHDGVGGLTLRDGSDSHLVEHGNLLVAARNALPALLRVVRALHAWDCAMGDFQMAQAQREAKGEVIPMEWSLKQCERVQRKLDEATALLRHEFSFEEK